MTESSLTRDILLACGNGPTRLFRQNTGMGWAGTAVSRSADTITLIGYRPLHAGLCVGSSDLIGWTRRDGVAIFTAIECKSPRGRLTGAQVDFLHAVSQAGGIAAECRTVEDAVRAIGR
jgi:hypothetical protein